MYSSESVALRLPLKIITMAAGLDAGVIGPQGIIYDGGSIEVGGRVIYNWDRQGHGNVDMTDVLAKSLNVGVAQVAVALGKDRFYTYARRFGFGRLTEVDLANEGPGTMKTPKDASWHASDLGTNSFGQGIAVTPVQIASAIGAVANEGLLMKPYIVNRITDGERSVEVKPTIVRRAVASETADTLTNMLVEALQRADAKALVPGYQVAGKTGTAQVIGRRKNEISRNIERPAHLKAHAWFVAYAPSDNPKIVVSVVVEHGEHGSSAAAPIAREIIKAYLLKDKPRNILRVESEQYPLTANAK